MTLAEKLKSIRKQAGMSQEQLAEILCTKKATISAYENDHIDIKSSIVLEIAKALNCSGSYLLEGKKEEAALTGLEEGKLFSRTPHPQCLQTLSALIRFVSCTATPGRPSSFTDTHAYGLFVQSIQTSQ